MFPVEKVNVSPSFTVRAVVKAPCQSILPPVEASIIAIQPTVPKLPPLAVNDCAFVEVVVPPGEDAEANVTDCREYPFPLTSVPPVDPVEASSGADV